MDIALNKVECEAANMTWTLPPNNYNTVFNSTKTFFEVSTLETWPDIMFAAANSQAEMDLPPKENARGYLKLLFVIFIFVTSFFVMNLLISVIVSEFNKQKLSSEGSADLNQEQKEWVKIQRFMAEVKPPVTMIRPENPFRLHCFNISNSYRFELTITGMILLNTIILCMDYYPASEQYLEVLEFFNNIFVAIFTMEAVIKLIGYGPTYYFYKDWNKFDFIIVILSIASLYQSEDFFNLTTFRIIRVARLLRMIKSSKEL